MIYKKTIPWIREWKVLIRSKSCCWQTLILWTFCTWTKAPTFLNYMVWAGACFQDLPNHTAAIYFPNCSCQNFPDLFSALHLQGHLVNVWHCQATFHAMLLKLLSLSCIWKSSYYMFIKNLRNKKQILRIIIFWSALRQIVYYDNEPPIFSVLYVWWVCFCFTDSASSSALGLVFVILLGKWCQICSSLCGKKEQRTLLQIFDFLKHKLIFKS